MEPIAEATVTFNLRDIVLMIGLFGTAFGIAASWINLKRDVKDLKTIVQNGLSHRVMKIEEVVSHLACSECQHRE